MLGTFTNYQVKHTFSDRKQRIYNFLTTNPVAVLSSIDSTGHPHGVVIYYAIDSDFSLTFLTKNDTKKYDNLKHNPQVVLTVFDVPSQTTAQIVGIAEEVSNQGGVNAIAGKIIGVSTRVKNSGLLPIDKLQAGAYAAFRIAPRQIRIATYARPESGGYDEIFESFESFELNEN